MSNRTEMMKMIFDELSVESKNTILVIARMVLEFQNSLMGNAKSIRTREEMTMMAIDYDACCRVLGHNIAFYRKQAGFTQEELAEYADVSTGYIAKLEGQSSPKTASLRVLLQIAAALNVSPVHLLENI